VRTSGRLLRILDKVGKITRVKKVGVGRVKLSNNITFVKNNKSMIYHTELQFLYKFVSNLTFSETYTRSQTEDDSLIDYTVSSICNNFVIHKFELKLIELTNEILDSTDDLSKESILELIISLENLKADLFDGSKYKKQINTIKGEEPKNDDAITSGMLYIGNISQIINKPQEFQVQIHNSISTLNQELKQIILADKLIPVEKLIWNVKPKVLAHLLIELDRKNGLNYLKHLEVQ
jgi:hypothetical protein